MVFLCMLPCSFDLCSCTIAFWSCWCVSSELVHRCIDCHVIPVNFQEVLLTFLYQKMQHLMGIWWLFKYLFVSETSKLATFWLERMVWFMWLVGNLCNAFLFLIYFTNGDLDKAWLKMVKMFYGLMFLSTWGLKSRAFWIMSVCYVHENQKRNLKATKVEISE